MIVGFLGYLFILKPYYIDAGFSEQEKQETDEVFNEIINHVVEDKTSDLSTMSDESLDETKVVETLEDENQSEAKVEDKVEAEETGDNTEKSVASTIDEKNAETGEPNANALTKLQTSINDQYVEAMFEIQVQAENLLNQLIDEAKFEYANLSPEEREDLIVTGKLASKYMARANELEKIVDGAVERLLSNMKAELEKNGLSTGPVLSLEEQYENEKKERRELLLTKALNYQSE